MPLTPKGQEILKKMEERYGQKKGEQVFYASANKGTITGVHADDAGVLDRIVQACSRFDAAQTLHRIGDAINAFNSKHVIVHSKRDAGVETRPYKKFKEETSKPSYNPKTGRMELHPEFAAAVAKVIREHEKTLNKK